MELTTSGERGGVRVLPSETRLVERARDLLAAGPLGTVELVERVCQLPGAPAVVAGHMARALFGAHPEFCCDEAGRWTVSALDALRPAADTDDDDLLALRYVVVDVETTGMTPEHGARITEIAAVVIEGGRITDMYDTLVYPCCGIPTFISRLTGITDAMVVGKPPFEHICGDVTRLLVDRVFVAHNASFDWRFVCAEVARASGERLQGRRLCTVRLARKLLPQLPRRSLDYVARHYGVDIESRHRALGDARATADVLLGLLRDAADRGCTTWSALDELLAPAAVRRRAPRRPSALPRPATAEEGA